MEEMLRVIGRKRMFLPIPFWVASLQGKIFGLLPKPLLTSDQVTQLRHDNVVSQAAKAEGRTLEGLGIRPQTIETILPSYLWRFRVQGQYSSQKPA
jgi:NADH dehydrogenase